jgi:uncharacterized protein (TIGR02271 family)
VGAAAGAIVGGLAGHTAAEGLNPTSEPSAGRYVDFEVKDRNEAKVGTVESVWLDQYGEPAYLAVRTGWLGMGKTHVVPAQNADVRWGRRVIRLPYTLDQVKRSPEFDVSAQLQSTDESQIGDYYGDFGFRREGWLAERQEQPVITGQKVEGVEKTLELKDEEIHVGKREVEYGGVRLRKVVRTETVNEPVELKREEIVIERVPGSGRVATEEFTEDEIYVPLRREEAVIAKEAHVREEVRVGKREEKEKQTVSETIRHEDVEIENQTTESRLGPTGERARTERYQPKERGRS